MNRCSAPLVDTPGGRRPCRIRPCGGLIGLVAAASLLLGCDRATTVIPESPPDAVAAVVKGLSDHRPQVLWDALPPSYQVDIRGLIQTFCRHMDTNVYDRTFQVLGKAVRVMKEKDDYIFNNPLALSTPGLESSMGSQWNDTVGLLQTIVTSDISSLHSLGELDPGEFLASTGRKVMSLGERLRIRSQRSPGANPWEKASAALKGAHVQFVPAEDGQGHLTFVSAANGSTQEVALTQVEGRWVPAEMAATWSARVAKAQQGLARLSGPDAERAKPVLTAVLATLDSAMDSLLRAKSQQEFDQTISSLTAIGGMLRALKSAP